MQTDGHSHSQTAASSGMHDALAIAIPVSPPLRFTQQVYYLLVEIVKLEGAQ